MRITVVDLWLPNRRGLAWPGYAGPRYAASGRAGLPPEAARTEGPPEGAASPVNQSREAHHPARPLHSPRGGHAFAGAPLGTQGIATEQAGPYNQASDLRVCTPGRTRTCNLGSRRKTRPVRLVLPEGIAAGRVRSIARPVTSPPAPRQRRGGGRDCHDERLECCRRSLET